MDRDARPLRYLALGDSYTIGEGVAASGRWPCQLARMLRDAGIAIDDPQIIATTGWTTDELSAGIDAAQVSPGFDLVSLLIGVNNQYRDRSADEYRAHFEGLLQRAARLARARSGIFVLSIPDWGLTPFAARDPRSRAQIAAAIDRFNAIAAECCSQACIAYIDITPISRLHGAEPSMLVGDGLHPSATMYRLWAEHALAVVRGLIEAPSRPQDSNG